MKNLVMIGLPGCGKTTFGRRLAQKLGREFVDIDKEIEKSCGVSIPQIFAEHGEAYFRDCESAVIREYERRERLVIATGGGAVLREENAKTLCANGFVIFIDRPVGNICADVKIANRPLLQKGAAAVEELSEKRRPIYERTANAIVDASGEIGDVLLQLEMLAATLAASGYAVIGDPIGHSLSPLLHKTAFSALNIDENYVAVHAPRGRLSSFVAAVRCSRIKGFNATIPHKQDIIPLLDEIDDEAQLCGAVNTVVHKNGILKGYNTDMEGLNLALKQAGHGFGGRNILLLGAGGAARAVALKAGLEKAKALHIAARSITKAEELAAHVRAATGLAVSVSGAAESELEAACRHSDLIINATPLGMSGMTQDHESLEFLAVMPRSGLVCDLVYNPLETSLLCRARELGIDTLNGLGMLVFQALIAQELFFDKKLEKQKIFAIILQRLEREFRA